MRIIWLLFVALLAGLAGTWWLTYRPAAAPATGSAEVAAPAGTSALPTLPVAQRLPASPAPARADSLVRFALAQLGAKYCYAGTSPATGFDCSGFVQYVYGHFHVEVPHSTALLIDAGRPVPRAQARPGDIVVFTGTDPASTTPGHAGIVISGAGQRPLRFVHSSSAKRESGVKISQVEDSGYEHRFLGVRRVI